ncbi:MAG TPA: hypothetical protein P5257_08540 [Bacteroidales bacterium]|nr:hypothetical protein [Bacteroidales bacterium]HRR94034.1 hypothetical protein [Bacteroidales bacterium]HRT90153.1 hypothetical protein [Bacteroidales bacterium]
MKKLLVSTLIAGFAAFSVYSQTLDEIVKRQSSALKEDSYDNVKTVKVTAKLNQMGMTLAMTTYFKAPDLSRIVLSFNGQEIVQVYDGKKGYLINPMAGSEPQELSPDQLTSLKNNSTLKSPISGYHRDKKLTLEGTGDVNGKPAFKLKATDGGNVIYYFIDKQTWLPVKMTMTSGGMNIDTYQEWADIKGIMLPKVTKTVAGNTEIVINVEDVEVNIPLDDSLFRI